MKYPTTQCAFPGNFRAKAPQSCKNLLTGNHLGVRCGQMWMEVVEKWDHLTTYNGSLLRKTGLHRILMFRGNHPTRTLTTRGRLKIPAEFKRTIDDKYGTQFYITSRDGRVAEIYPFEEWQRVEEKLAKAEALHAREKEVSRIE